MSARTTIVVPTVGRASLGVLLHSLLRQDVPLDAPVVVVDDRRGRPAPLEVGVHEVDARGVTVRLDVRLVRSGGGGPARARNIGWRHARTPWVSFLDDDVEVGPRWWSDLLADLDAADAVGAVGSQGRVRVPLPSWRRPTDWERGTKGLETARWITADLSYRRSEVADVGGFDERFPRAFREDADLALRLGGDHGRILQGRRLTTHRVRPAADLASLHQQAGNADDQLMRALHGRDWHKRAEASVGRITHHRAVTTAGLAAVAAQLFGRPRIAAACLAGWALGTADFARVRIIPGPWDRGELRRMLLTSAAIPPVATYHSLRGWWRHRRAEPWRGLPDLVVLDRDGTLVEDVPYNGDPARVRPVPGAREALDRLRAVGVRTAVVTNQSGIARGLISREQVDAVNRRVVELLGPFDAFRLCPHGPDDGCSCRKPQPGMVKEVCGELGVAPARTVVIGDIGADVGAARWSGARSVLVPTPVTRPEEVAAAPRVASSLVQAVDTILEGAW